ncbi:hypothetical protein GF352_03250 [archaeon]|nr:hypothetical protein [archaeon]
MAKGSGKVSVAAWDKALTDINSRLERMEKQINELSEKTDNKVNIKAWEKSLVDIDNQIKSLTIKELKNLDHRLDKTVELVSELTKHLNEKVTVSAWDRLCESNERLINKVDALTEVTDNITKKVIKMENLLKGAKVSEEELKELLRSI